jgi:formylglycine-generating enzyme
MKTAMRGQQTLLWAAISVVLGVVCLGVAEPQSSKDSQPVSSAESNRGGDGAPMVFVAAGPFIMGSNDGLPNERPEHTVTLDPYYIDQYEITLNLYRKFLEAEQYESPPTWNDEATTTVGDRPAIGMKWKSAAA